MLTSPPFPSDIDAMVTREFLRDALLGDTNDSRLPVEPCVPTGTSSLPLSAEKGSMISPPLSAVNSTQMTCPSNSTDSVIKAFITSALSDIITTGNSQLQTTAIQRAYDVDCKLQNPYMILHGREEIIKSYRAFSTSNTSITLSFDSISYDSCNQICMVDLHQTIHPKAMGGVIGIKMHIILKLQLEEGSDMTEVGDAITSSSPCRIVHQEEIHVTSDFLSQVPLVGGFYDNTFRSALGQLSIAGTSLLSYTGLLDLVPRAVDKSAQAARAVRNRAGAIASGTIRLGVGTLEATGVSSLLHWMSEHGKCAAVSLAERGNGERVQCYSPRCAPGKLCYSPTCTRNTAPRLLSRGMLAAIVKGVYMGAGNGGALASPTSSVGIATLTPKK